MRINYNIVWVEDDEDYFRTINQRFIRDYLRNKGFHLQITPYFKIDDDDAFIKDAKRADLIVMDYQLGEKEDGSDIIKHIREDKIHTEIVFYSSYNEDDLRKEVFEKKLDGVFCRARINLERSLINIIYSTIRKILDLENFRGLVLAEISEIDHLLIKILKKYRSTHTDKSVFIFEKMQAKVQSSSQRVLDLLVASVDHTNDKHFEHVFETYADFSKRLNVILSILKKEQFNDIKEKLDNLISEQNANNIVLVRNLLAHASPVPHGDGFIFSGLPNKEGELKHWILNEESSEEYRKNIIHCRELLDELLTKL